jgi:allantoin racemase
VQASSACAPPTHQCWRSKIRTPGRRVIQREIERALAEDGAEAVVLDCARMTGLVLPANRRKAAVLVLEGAACAASLAESLVRLDLKTSKRDTYAAPLAKLYAGEFKGLSPG